MLPKCKGNELTCMPGYELTWVRLDQTQLFCLMDVRRGSKEQEC